MFGTVEVRAESYALVGDFAQFAQAENLKTAGIRKNRARPGHELVQPAQFADQFVARPQKQMVSIRQQNLHAEVFEVLLGLSLYRRRSSHWHECRRIDYAVRSGKPPQSRTSGIGGEDFEFKTTGRWIFGTRGHPVECIRRS